MHVTTLGKLLDTFNLCNPYEIMAVAGDKKDISKPLFSMSDVLYGALLIDSELLQFLFGNKPDKNIWSFKDLLDNINISRIDDFLDGLYTDEDHRLNDTKIIISEKTIEKVIQNGSHSRDSVLRSLLYDFPNEKLVALCTYLEIDFFNGALHNKLVEKIKGFPRKRFYKALYQIIVCGVT